MFILRKHCLLKFLSPAVLAAALFMTTTGLANSNANATSKITVHNGDNLTGLSSKYHVSKVSLEVSNHLGHNSTLKIGQKLNLPDDTSSHVGSNRDNGHQNTDDSYQVDQSGRDSSLSPSEQSAKDWISYHESRNDYNVSNGEYYGKYELNISLLHGNYSHANQNRMANKYVHQRYGSWVKAKQFWEAHDWY